MPPSADENLYEVEELLVQPGTYFNPQTEVVVVVDDSTSIDQEVFNMERYEGAEWVRHLSSPSWSVRLLSQTRRRSQARFDTFHEVLFSLFSPCRSPRAAGLPAAEVPVPAVGDRAELVGGPDHDVRGARADLVVTAGAAVGLRVLVGADVAHAPVAVRP